VAGIVVVAAMAAGGPTSATARYASRAALTRYDGDALRVGELDVVELARRGVAGGGT